MSRTTALLVLLALAPACARRVPQGLEPCELALQSLCSKVDPGEGRLLACLRQHSASLSTPCRERVTLLSPPADTSPMGAQAQRACLTDMKVHCMGVEPGGGRIKKCLSAHLSRVSPPCKAALEAEAGTAPAR